MEDADQICRVYFSKPSLRIHQRPVVEAVLAGDNVIGVLATGGGKSLTYQVPYMLTRGITIVVSPLIALIDDQVNGLPTAVKTSTIILSGDNGMLSKSISTALDIAGRCLIYTGPEKLSHFVGSHPFPGDVRRLVLDEAHCASEWGHTFRDAYLLLPNLWEQLGRPQIQAMTATASASTLDELMAMFPVSFKVIRSSIYRSNLHLSAIEHQATEHRDNHLQMLVRNRVGPVIIYANSRSYVDRTSKWLCDIGLKVEGFHAGLTTSVRSDIQKRFIAGETEILVATIAFGMGIDKSDVRHVFHVEPPSTLEDYQQQVGRAGRDGGPSWCVVFDTMNKRRHRNDALRTGMKLAKELDQDSFSYKLILRRLELERFLKLGGCRHNHLMKYSGESPSKQKCGHCDNCCGR